MEEQNKKTENKEGMLGKIIITVMLIILVVLVMGFLIIRVRGLDIYPGSTLQVNTGFDALSNYTIQGNLSEINITFSSGIAYINIPTDYVPSAFNITFYGLTGGQTVYVSSGGGGGSSTVYIQNQTNHTEYVNVPKEVTKIVEKNNTIYLNNDSNPPVIPSGTNKYLIWIVLAIIIVAIVIIMLVVQYLNSKRRKELRAYEGFEDMK